MSTEGTQKGEKIAFGASDDWDLIKIIAQSISKDPRYSIQELVSNALDAFSRVQYSPKNGKTVSILIKKKDKKDPHIKVIDNGPGWTPKTQAPNYGAPDFEYTVKHIGDSIKKKYAVYQKARDEGKALGQYAIGLFSFWALGKKLTAYSRSVLDDGKIGPCSVMIWQREIKEATIKHNVEPPEELQNKAGTVVIINQLEKAQMNLVTGNILALHLSRTCRTVLMKSNIELVIDDHGVKVPVKPKKYEGIKFPIDKYETLGFFGPISLEIFAFPPVESPEELRVPIFKNAAKAYDDISELPELNVYPWNAKKVYGEINYPFANLAPSRAGFLNDRFLEAFIKTMQKITVQLANFVSDIEAQKRARQSDRFNALFQEKWKEIFKQLGPEWHKAEGGTINNPDPPPPLPTVGPMYRVEISPNETKIERRTFQSFTARPYDINGNIIRDPSLIYYWKLEKKMGLLKNDMNKTCVFQAGNFEGIETLSVTVFQYVKEKGIEKTIKKTAATNVWVVKELPPPKLINRERSGDKLPTPEEGDLGEDGPHSKLKKELNIVTINDHHKDFKEARNKDDETYYRYYNCCYAKELAVERWKNLDSIELSERIIDLLALSERVIDWKEIVKKKRGRHPKRIAAINS